MIHLPLNRWYFIKSEILQITLDDSLHQRKLNILHFEEKICRYTFHQELLQNCKKNKIFTMGMSPPQFYPSLCNDEKANKLCRNVLRNASFKLRDIMLEGVSTNIVNLTSEKTNLVKRVKENSTVEKFNLVCQFVAKKI